MKNTRPVSWHIIVFGHPRHAYVNVCWAEGARSLSYLKKQIISGSAPLPCGTCSSFPEMILSAGGEKEPGTPHLFEHLKPPNIWICSVCYTNEMFIARLKARRNNGQIMAARKSGKNLNRLLVCCEHWEFVTVLHTLRHILKHSWFIFSRLAGVMLRCPRPALFMPRMMLVQKK